MPRWSKSCAVLFVAGLALLAACSNGPSQIAQFWRPISEPNIQLPLHKAQEKLDFDLSQCHCGIYPTNVPQPDLNSFQMDKQRLAETSVTIGPNEKGECIQQPSMVVQECMRDRGWEVTSCSGRMPLPGGGSLCASYAPQE